MTGRIYPNEISGPFPTPPRTVVDEAGRTVAYRVADAEDRDRLWAMYHRFHPDDRAQGLPPEGDQDLDTWVDALLDGAAVNLVAVHESVVGHAVLVPDGGATVDRLDAARGVEGPDAATGGPPGEAADTTDGDATSGTDETTCELAIFVRREYQDAGIGTDLLETLLGEGRDRGVERVWLTVERWNEPAVALYRSVGFETSDAEAFELEMTIRLAE